MNCLSNRYQFASINNTSSFFSRIECGVPQGSNLGPFFVILFNNDIPSVSTKQKFLLFADDANIIYVNTDTKAILNAIIMDMIKIGVD